MYTNLACCSSSVSLSLLYLSRSLLLLSLFCLLSLSWTLLAMVPSWHSEYSPLSFTCSVLVYRILSFTIHTRDIPLSIVLYRLPPVDYTQRTIVHRILLFTARTRDVPSTTDQCGVRSGSPQLTTNIASP